MSIYRSALSNPTAEEKTYFAAINAAFEGGSRELISNGKPGHAAYLILKFLEYAEKSVQICTGRLAQAVEGVLAYGDTKIANAAIRFLQKPDTELSIILFGEEEPDLEGVNQLQEHPFLAAVMRAEHNLLGTLRVFQVKADYYRDLAFRHHFLVMDDCGVRVESHDLDGEASDIKAIATLNDKTFARSFAGAFDAIKAESDTLLTIPATA